MPGIYIKSRQFGFLEEKRVFLLVSILFSTFYFLISNHALAANISWDNGGGDNLWSTDTNWAGNVEPGTSDVAVFDNTTSSNVTINANISVQGINVSSTYNGTITQSTATVTIGSSGFTMASGTWIGGTGSSSKIDINDSNFALSGGYFSAPSSTGATSSIDVERNFTLSGGTFSATNATTTFDGASNLVDNSTLTCTGTFPGTVVIRKQTDALVNVSFTLSSGCTIDLGVNPTSSVGYGGVLTNNGTINASGTWHVASPQGVYANNATSVNNGTITHSGTGWNIDINFVNSSGATTTFVGTDITMAGDFTQSGTFDLTGKTITFDGSANNSNDSTITCTGNLGGTVVFGKTGLQDVITIASGCSVDLGTNPTSTFTSADSDIINNGTINASGTWTMNGAVGSAGDFTNNGTVSHNGTGWDINDAGYIHNSGATTTYVGTSITIEENFTLNGGTFDLAGKTVTFDGGGSTDDTALTCNTANIIVDNLTINKTNPSATWATNTDCTISGNFTRTDGPVNASSGLTTLTLLGNFSAATSDQLGQPSSTLSFASSGIQYASSTGVPWGGPLNVSTTLGELRLSSNFISSSTCDIIEGTLSLLGRNLTCGGALTVQNGGTLRLRGGETVTTPTFQATSTLFFTGDGDSAYDAYNITSFSTSVTHLTVSSTDSLDSFGVFAPLDLNGNFSFATGTVVSSSTINIGGNWTNTSGTFQAGTSTVVFDTTGTSVITGTTTFNNLTASTAGKTLQFRAGQTTTVSSTLTLTGASGNLISLRSTTDGTQWRINPLSAASVSYLDVKDSNNVGAEITCSNCTDSGNNTGWTFPSATASGGGGGGGGSPSAPSSGGFAVSINKGVAETTSTLVYLYFTGGTDSYWIDFGENSLFVNGSYKREVYADSGRGYPFMLSSASGTKSVYARFWNLSFGSPSPIVSDTIVLKDGLGEEPTLPPTELIEPLPPVPPPPSEIPPGFKFTIPLYLGLTDTQVQYLQVFLAREKEIYPEGLVTGYFGTLTREAVRRFQCKWNIICDPQSEVYGYVGPATRAKLNELLGEKQEIPLPALQPTLPPAKPALSAAQVQALQTQIDNLQKQLKILIEKRLELINQELKRLGE